MLPPNLPPPLPPQPVEPNRTALIVTMIVVSLLLLGGAVFAAVYFTYKAIASRAEAARSVVEQRAARSAKFPPLEFPSGSVTSDGLRPHLVAWMENELQVAGLQPTAPATLSNEKWRQLVEAFVARETFAPGSPSAITLQSMAAELEPVADQHPVAAFVVARSLGGQHPASVALLEKAYDGLMESPRGATLAYLAGAELAAMSRATEDGAESDAAAELAVQRPVRALRKALAETDGCSGLHDHVVSYLFGGLKREFLDKAHLEVYEAVAESPKAKPWLKQWMKGMHHVRAAWEARGSGYSDTVSDTSWRIFFNEINKARTSLEAACRENPQSAEPAALLITCAMANSEDAVGDMLAAVNLATSVHMDHASTYNRLYSGLLPRWHGSHAMMVKFGEACLASGRFDSQVPWRYLQAHKEVAGEWDLPDYYFLELRDFSKFRTLFEGYENEPGRVAWRGFDRSMAALVSFKCAQYEEAQRWLNKLEGKVDERALEYWGYTDSQLLVGKTAAFSGSRGGILRKAEKAEQAFQSGNALTGYQQALEEGKDLSQVGLAYLKSRCAAMELEKAMQERREFPLQPGADFVGWTRQGGGWRVLPDGGVEHGGTPSMSTTTHQGRVGQAFVLEGDLEFVNSGGKSEAWIAVGYPERPNDYRLYAVRFEMVDGRMRALLSSGMGATARRVPLGAGAKAHFVIKASLAGINLAVNGEQIWTREPLPGATVKESYSQVGLGASTATQTDRVIFRNLKLMKK